MKKILFIFLFWIISLFPLTAINGNEIITARVVKPFNKEVPWEIELGPKGRVEVKLMSELGFMYVNVLINNQGPFRFLLDTGADSSIISYELVKKLNLTAIASKKRIFETNHKKAEVDTELFIIQELKIDNALIKHVPFIATNTASDDFQLLKDLNIIGILGANLFHDIILTLDLPHGKLLLSYHEQAKINKDNIIKISEQYYLPVINIKVNSKQNNSNYDFLVDSGYNGSIKMPVCFNYDEKQSQQNTIVFYDAFNEAENAFMDELHGDFMLGSKKFENLSVKYTLGNCGVQKRWGLIGTRFLQHQTLSIDQRNREVIIH